jgi:hypothetical protein
MPLVDASCEGHSCRSRLINRYELFRVDVKADIQSRYSVARYLYLPPNRNEAGMCDTDIVCPRWEVNRIHPFIARPQLPFQPLALDDDARAGDVYADRV